MRYAFGLSVLISTAGVAAYAEDFTYSDELCAKSTQCSLLMNNAPDYSTVEAEVLEIIDGDSVRVRLHLLPGLEYVVNVRIRGIDTPELRDPDCEQERLLGKEAKAFLERRLKTGSWVYLDSVEYDKYGGRVVAAVFRRMSERVLSLGKELVDNDKALPYGGQGPRHNWCLDEFGEPL